MVQSRIEDGSYPNTKMCVCGCVCACVRMCVWERTRMHHWHLKNSSRHKREEFVRLKLLKSLYRRVNHQNGVQMSPSASFLLSFYYTSSRWSPAVARQARWGSVEVQGVDGFEVSPSFGSLKLRRTYGPHKSMIDSASLLYAVTFFALTTLAGSSDSDFVTKIWYHSFDLLL